MTENLIAESGWRPIPMPLKILAVVMVVWAVGAVMNLPNLMANGLPLFGVFVRGLAAAAVVFLLDIVGPFVFLFGLWNRKWWAPRWAFAYIGIFILNSIVALFTVRQELGLPQILIPTLASLIFFSVIYWKRGYFAKAS